MKVLVTGATGFVGACLTRRLVETGYDVHIFSRQASDKWRISDLLGQVTNHELDLRNNTAVEKAVAKISPLIVCHLAAYGGFAFQNDTPAIIGSNFIGLVNLLRACEKVGFDCFVNTGSSSEYGKKPGPIKETDILEPVGDYGVSKAAAALFCQSEAAKGLPIITLRLFSPYGPWDDPKRLIPYVIKSLLRQKAPGLSSPKSVRDYIFIDDVLELYLKVIKKPPGPGDIFNAGSGIQHSIEEVAAVLREIIRDAPTPEWGVVEHRQPEPETWVADINKIKKNLDWEPSTSLRNGLEKTVAWFRENLDLYP